MTHRALAFRPRSVQEITGRLTKSMLASRPALLAMAAVEESLSVVDRRCPLLVAQKVLSKLPASTDERVCIKADVSGPMYRQCRRTPGIWRPNHGGVVARVFLDPCRSMRELLHRGRDRTWGCRAACGPAKGESCTRLQTSRPVLQGSRQGQERTAFSTEPHLSSPCLSHT